SYQRARRHGIAAFVSKPFRLAEVVETCRRILEGARPLQGRAEATETTPPVQIRDEANVPLVRGWLIDVDERGARGDLGTPREAGHARQRRGGAPGGSTMGQPGGRTLPPRAGLPERLASLRPLTCP